MNRFFSVFIVILTIILMAAIYLYKPVSFNEISSVNGFVRYAKSLGIIMPVFIFVVTVNQAIIPAIPFAVLCSANGLLFGVVKGILFTWAATLTGAAILFFLARKFGYKWAEKFAYRYNFKRLQSLNGKKGFGTILLLRLMPHFPAPLINVSAGISDINFVSFIGASALGKFPFIIGYTLMGYSILQTSNYLFGASIFAVLIVVPYLLKKIKSDRNIREEMKKE